MAKRQIYNPVSGKLDLIDEDVFIPSYNAFLSQVNTDPPVEALIGTNTLGIAIVWEYFSVGTYVTNSLGIIGLNAFCVGGGKGGIIQVYKGGSTIYVESRDYSGVLSDNILAGASVKIELIS